MTLQQSALQSVRSARPQPARASTDAAEPVASVGELHVSFSRGGRTIEALRGVSLELAPGEILGLVGESGSGKSVLGLTMLGLVPAGGRLQGRVKVCGVDVVGAGSAELRSLRASSLGAVFQDPMTSLNPTMRIERQLTEACGSRAEAKRLLDAVGVPDPVRRLRCYPHQLSGGLRQRVMIAMAIAGDPKLVVADEPTTALDVTVQAQILLLIRQLCDELGTTFLLVTHDLGVAAQVADRIGVLYSGRLAEVGESAALLQAPRHPYTMGLLRSRLTLHAPTGTPIMTLRGEPPRPGETPPGCPFESRCDRRVDECAVVLPDLAPVLGMPGRLSACIRDAAAPVTFFRRRPPDDEEASQPLAFPPAVGDPGGPAALRMIAIHKYFDRRARWPKKDGAHVLRGVDLEIRPGEAVALVGESGCGKSTLLRIAAGLASADDGEVELPPGVRPQMVFQDAGASLTPWLTIGELVGERLRNQGMKAAARRDRVAAALAAVGLPPEVAIARPHELSGGQRQRACLARTIVVPPELLLCDEPTSALDVSLAATVLNLIGRLRRELGMAILFVTHDLAAARVVADRVAVMYLGRIVEVGPAEALVSSPGHPYTQVLLGAVPGAGARPGALRGEPADAHRPPPGCAFHPRCNRAGEICSQEDPVLIPSDELGRPVACWRTAAPLTSAPELVRD